MFLVFLILPFLEYTGVVKTSTNNLQHTPDWAIMAQILAHGPDRDPAGPDRDPVGHIVPATEAPHWRHYTAPSPLLCWKTSGTCRDRPRRPCALRRRPPSPVNHGRVAHPLPSVALIGWAPPSLPATAATAARRSEEEGLG
jgi:hypothetical protein